MYLAMNNFRVAPAKSEEFETVWRERKSYLDTVPGFKKFSFLRGPEEDGVQWYASHTVWEDEASFRAWTESEAFKKAHAQGGKSSGALLGPPKFMGWEAILGEV